MAIIYDYGTIRPGAASADHVAADGDRHILRLFYEWMTALRHAESFAATADDETFAGLVEKANRFRDAIADTPAEQILGLAVKMYFLYRAGHGIVAKGSCPAIPAAEPANRR